MALNMNPSDILPKFELTKLSDPGREWKFDYIADMVDELRNWVCASCMIQEDEETPYHCMTVHEQLDFLLGSPCGAEFTVCANTQRELDEVLGNE